MAINGTDELLENTQEGTQIAQDAQDTTLASIDSVNSEVEQEVASTTQDADKQELLDDESETSNKDEDDEQESDADVGSYVSEDDLFEQPDEDEDDEAGADDLSEQDVQATADDVQEAGEDANPAKSIKDEAQPRSSIALRMAKAWSHYGQQ